MIMRRTLAWLIVASFVLVASDAVVEEEDEARLESRIVHGEETVQGRWNINSF